MGWPAMLAVLFGSLMVASATAPTHFNATGTSTFLQGNALELIDSQRDIRADLIGGTILGTTPHAMAYLKLGIMYDVHLYIARSTLIFAEERTKWNFLVAEPRRGAKI